MGLRYCVVFIAFVLVFISNGGSMALAQQDADNQDNQQATDNGENEQGTDNQENEQLMTPVNGTVAEQQTIYLNEVAGQLDLKMYEAAIGDISLCGDDDFCLKFVNTLKSWLCAADACDGVDKSKKPLDCLEGMADKYSKETQDQMNSVGCSLIKSPSAETRQAFLSITKSPGNFIVEYVAYLLALKGSSKACEAYIKDYVGEYGPRWKYKWYRALSGCRILGGDSTRELEEKSFYTWFRVNQGIGKCSDIFIGEMRNACEAPGAASSVHPPSKPEGDTH